MTWYREEFDSLTKLLRSRTVEPSTSKSAVDYDHGEQAIVTEQVQHNEQSIMRPSTSHPEVNYERAKKTIVSEQEHIMRSSSLQGGVIDPSGDLHVRH